VKAAPPRSDNAANKTFPQFCSRIPDPGSRH
jgi:hypothetical protein